MIDAIDRAQARGECDVAIVGGGFAGTMVAVQLANRCPIPPRIVMFDSAGAFGRGAAYSPASDHCLLNVRAKAMGAFPDDEGHFLRWLVETGYGDGDPDLGDRFLPRKLYGSYLAGLLEGCRGSGKLVERVDRIVDVGPRAGGYGLLDATGGRTFAKTVVFALGNLPPGGIGDSTLSEAMAAYAEPAWKLLASGDIEPDADVLVVGTGLTALDVMLHLAANGHRGRIEMLSRHGRFPLPHASPPAVPAPTPATLDGSPQHVMRALRRLVREAEAGGNTWHDVIDAVRPHVSAVWQKWTLVERRQFFRHLAPYWEVHRHRAPASTLAVRDALIDAGRLHVHAGRLFALDEDDGALRASYVDRKIGRAVHLRVDAVVDCTGPRRDFRRSGDALIDALFARGLATTDPLGIGFAAEADGALVGRERSHPGLFALGTPLRGKLYECGAVREVRAQAETVARAVLLNSLTPAHP